MWILFLFVVSILLTWLVLQVGRRASPDITIGFITGLWLVVIPLILDALKKMVEKREEFSLATWMLPGATRLDLLVKNDRARADRLVREQCCAELHGCTEMLADMVTRIYKDGETSLALKLRELKQKYAKGEEDVAGSGFGAPAYLEEVHLSDQAWERMLDYDEDLLLRAGGLAETVHAAQLGLSAEPGKAPDVHNLELQLDGFLYHFGGRSRVLKVIHSER
jgi:hypothetical protein